MWDVSSVYVVDILNKVSGRIMMMKIDIRSECDAGRIGTVSYTHLDVYKRQVYI